MILPVYVFDLDGTLVDSVDAHVKAWVEALAALGASAREEDVRPLMGLPAGEIARRLLPERAKELADLKVRLFLEKYINYVKPYDDVGVVELLPRPIAVVTSSSGVLARAMLKRIGLGVDYVIGGDEVPKGKPSPDPLYVLSSMAGVPPSRMVVVGDSEYDVEMARAAGARPICIARGREPCRKDVEVITTLYALIKGRDRAWRL